MLKYLKKSGIPWEFPRHQVLQVASHYLPEERRSSTADSAQAKNSQPLGPHKNPEFTDRTAELFAQSDLFEKGSLFSHVESKILRDIENY